MLASYLANWSAVTRARDGMGTQCLGIVALTSRYENAPGIAQPFEHRVHVVVAELPADKAMQGEATL